MYLVHVVGSLYSWLGVVSYALLMLLTLFVCWFSAALFDFVSPIEFATRFLQKLPYPHTPDIMDFAKAM